MVTAVGLQENFIDVLNSLLELDYDAIEAYQAAINRMDNTLYKRQLEDFKSDHERHTRELSYIIRQLGGEAAGGPSLKQILTQGKVVIANMFGDRAILAAMKTNEDDTNTAYERALNHKHAALEAKDILERGLADERRHRAWLEQTVALMKEEQREKENA